MKRGNRKWATVAVLTVLGVASLASVGEARRFFRWFFRPPVPVIEFAELEGEATRGRLRLITVAEGEITSNVRTSLEDGSFTATVVDGELAIDPIVLLSEIETDIESLVAAGSTEVVIEIDPTTLRRNFFNSQFFARATALITVVEDEVPPEDDDPPVLSLAVPGEPTEVPVVVFGSIHQHSDGTYHLRGSARGFSRTIDEETGEASFALFSVRLNGESVEEDEEEEDPPVELPTE